MSTTNLFSNCAKNPVTAIILLVLAGVMAYLMVGDVARMQQATTNYEYYKNLCYLVDNICRTYFFCIFLLMAYLTYIKKQYTKWCIWLFYIAGVSALFYFGIARYLYEYIFNNVESAYLDKLPSIAGTLFVGPIYWILVGYFFVPKILKDARILKEEQDLTI